MIKVNKFQVNGNYGLFAVVFNHGEKLSTLAAVEATFGKSAIYRGYDRVGHIFEHDKKFYHVFIYGHNSDRARIDLFQK